jgi:hypothetical protein
MTEKSRTYILLALAILAGIAAIHSCKLPEVVPSPNALFSVEGFDCIQAEDGCLLTLLNSSEYGESFLWEIGDTTSLVLA